MILAGNKRWPFLPQIIIPSYSFLLSLQAKDRMSHLIFTTSFLPVPQSSSVPDDEQAVRGHPANRSFSKHPSVLCGSDLITVPGPCHLCRRRPLGGHRSPSHPAAIEDYSPPLPRLLRPLFLLPRGILTFSDRLNSFTSWVVFMSFIFLSPPSSSSSFLL